MTRTKGKTPRKFIGDVTLTTLRPQNAWLYTYGGETVLTITRRPRLKRKRREKGK